MPLKKDPKGGGTEIDGTISKLYCSKCYEGGKFVYPEITIKEMQAIVKNRLKEMGSPDFIAGMFTKRLPKLERWKSLN